MGVAKEKESQSFPLRGVRVRKILRQPILEPTLENMNSIASFNKVVKMVDEIISLKEADINNDSTSLESKLEKYIYELYDLTEEEIKIIEGNE